jgi:hypothetical protein
MKLYTEEQVREVVKKAFWQDFYEDDTDESLISELTPIELPTEEEIAENAYIWCQVPDERGYINSGDDYDNHELPAFIAGAQWVVNLVKQQDNE